jgi:spermidine synthase
LVKPVSCARDERVKSAIGRDRLTPILPALFFLSGASSLIFETIFTRLLTYTFGNTAYAVSTVLAIFLGGLALGAFVIGKWTDQRRPSLWIYGILELLIGTICLIVPSLFRLLTDIYVALYQRFISGPIGLIAIRIALGLVLIVVPTFLMGGTLPSIARYLAARRSNYQVELDRFYALNTLGGALGVLVCTYILIPSLGIEGTIWIASATSISIFVAIALMSKRRTDLQQLSECSFRIESRRETESMSRLSGLLLFGSFLTGAVALAYEVAWTHVLSFLIGNSVYAFGLMLFTFLCGLGLGARIVVRHLERQSVWAHGLVGSQVLLGVVVFVTLPLWPHIPDLFAHGVSGAYNRDLLAILVLLVGRITYVFWRNHSQVGTHELPWYRAYEPHMEGLAFAVLVAGIMPFLWKYPAVWFMAGELLRFLSIFSLLIIPSLLLGLAFPLLLNLSSETSKYVGGTVGKVYAVNTLGAVTGSLVAGFGLLPRLGSLMTLRGCAAVNVLLGLCFAIGLLGASRSRRWTFAVSAVLLATLILGTPGGWDMGRITGSYAYFSDGWPARQTVFVKEDVQGGLTSVAQIGPVRVLLSNGKFQGDNFGEVGTQSRFALIPALFTDKFDRALVIGLGTGNALQTVSRFPFRQIDVAELAPQIVNAARLWFMDVNGSVLDRDPRVRLSIADGRNFLLLSRQRYDMITIEITSLWISGEGDLYNREFYALCRSHLGERGILQQWVALHHLRPSDLFVILNTAAQVFPHVAFFQSSDPSHGLLIASSSPLEVDYSRVAGFEKDPGLKRDLKAAGITSAWSLLGELMLYGNSFQEALSALSSLTGMQKNLVSTDFHPYLEYQTPKGVAMPYNTIEPNTRFLRQFRPQGLPSDLVIRGLPSQNERNLILGYVAKSRGELAEALACFARVEGPVRVRAQSEISDLGAIAPGATSIPANLSTACK